MPPKAHRLVPGSASIRIGFGGHHKNGTYYADTTEGKTSLTNWSSSRESFNFNIDMDLIKSLVTQKALDMDVTYNDDDLITKRTGDYEEIESSKLSSKIKKMPKCRVLNESDQLITKDMGVLYELVILKKDTRDTAKKYGSRTPKLYTVTTTVKTILYIINLSNVSKKE
jgi:hypothetical protein